MKVHLRNVAKGILFALLCSIFSVKGLRPRRLSPTTPTKEYISFGNQTTAIEVKELSISVSPYSASLAAGQTQKFSASLAGSGTCFTGQYFFNAAISVLQQGQSQQLTATVSNAIWKAVKMEPN